MTDEIEVDAITDEGQVARTPVSASPDVADPLRSLRLVKWLTRLFVYPGVTLLMPLDHFLTGLTWEQAISVHLGGYVIATIAIELAFGQAFKLRKHAAYPNVLVMELGEAQTVDAAARLALPVLHRLLGVRASFISLGGADVDLSLVSVSGVSRGAAERLLKGGMATVREAMRSQRPVPWDPAGAVSGEAGVSRDQRMVFVPVVALQQPIGVLALVGRKGNGDLKDGQLLSNIGSALGFSLENLRQEESLRESEERFRTLVESTFEGIIISEGGKVLEANESFATMFGYESAEVIGLSPLEMTTPESAELIMKNIQSGVEKPYEIIGVKKDGTTFDIEVVGKKCLYQGRNARVTAFRDITEIKRAEETLRESEEKYRDLVENMSEVLYALDKDGRITYVSPVVEQLGGYTPSELIGRSFTEFIHPDDLLPLAESFQRTVSGNLEPSEFRIFTKSGEIRWVRTSSRPVFEGDRIIGLRAVMMDITERKQAEETLRRSETKFRTLTETVAAAVFIFQGTRLRYVNSLTEALTGYEREELLAMHFWEMIHPDFRELVKERGLARQRGERVPTHYEVKLVTKNGDERWVDFTLGVIEFEGKPAVLGTGFDITERKRAEETIKHMAYHDSLTDLPNRTLFQDRLTVALAQARRKRRTAAVMFLDLDRFKVVNDTVGHALGDDLLQGVAERLTGLVREGDAVARVGGDEFTLLLAEVERAEDMIEIAERVLDTLRQPWVLNGHEFRITASIGIAMFPNDGEDADSLLRNADTAMYRAKDQGRDNYKLYTPAMNARIAERLALENSLRHGLERGEFLVYYQPQVDIASGRIVGMEALVRWQHPERGLVFPAEFIPVAEETGLIVPLGAWVMRTACAQNKAWQAAGFPPMRVAVNLSARQFQQRNFTEMVDEVLKEADLEARWLQLEITEGVAMQDVESNIAVLRELRQMGVQIAIDDFGTGHSSLSYLSRLPIDVVKIDRTFVQDLTTDPNGAAIARSIIVMAHNLKLRVIAEGVETEEQLAFLKKRRCDEMQGYLFSKPAPAEAFEEMLRQDGQPSRARKLVRASR